MVIPYRSHDEKRAVDVAGGVMGPICQACAERTPRSFGKPKGRNVSLKTWASPQEWGQDMSGFSPEMRMSQNLSKMRDFCVDTLRFLVEPSNWNSIRNGPSIFIQYSTHGCQFYLPFGTKWTPILSRGYITLHQHSDMTHIYIYTYDISYVQ